MVMKKRFLSMIFATTMCAALLPTTALAESAPTLPKSEEITFTLNFAAEEVENHVSQWIYGDGDGAQENYDYKDVNIKVTVEGYLGELDSSLYENENSTSKPYSMGIDFPIVVIEKGSKVILDFESKDPMASYNFFMNVDVGDYAGYTGMYEGAYYNSGAGDIGNPRYPKASPEYPYTLQLGDTGASQNFVVALDDDTWELTPSKGLSQMIYIYSTPEPTQAELAEIFKPVVVKESTSTTYSGGGTNMTSTALPVGASYKNIIYGYILPSFFAIEQGDIDELAANGKAHIGYDSLAELVEAIGFSGDYAESSYDRNYKEYPGLLELFGGEAVEGELPYTMEMDSALYDVSGNPMHYANSWGMIMSFTNISNQSQNIYGGLLVKGGYGYELFYFSETVGVGKTVTSDIFSTSSNGLLLMEEFEAGNVIWIEFDSASEMSQIKNSMPATDDVYANLIDEDKVADWLKDTFGYIV